MSSFFQNFGSQVGQFSQTFGSQVGQLSQNLGNSVNQAIHQGFNTSIQLNEELRVGSHTVLVKEKIAEGGFGLIVLVADIHTQKEMVLKRCNIDREEVFKIVKKEISILQRFSGPYVTKMIENDVNFVNNRPDSREALLLLEYYPGGHLLHRLNQRQGSYLPSESIYRIFGQILMGVKLFHENNPPIINRDLKLENILFGTDGKVRLCDFGSCEESPIHVRNQSEREKVEEAVLKETTQMYRAPEMVNLYMRDQLTEKTDIWALGCIFYSLIFLKHPFQDVGSLAILQAKYNIPADSTVSPDAITFLHRMLDIDPEARPSVAELLQQLVEIAAGRPLPPYELSAEALKRREERIAADQLRESKNKKKAAPVAPPRKGAPPAANSVAAKRLAAKRGQPIPTSPVGNNSTLNDSFEPFSDGGGISAKSNFSVSTVASGNVATEDFFGDHSPPPTTSQSNTNSAWFEPDFGDNQTHVHQQQHHNPPSSGGFDPFADEDDGAAHSKQTAAPTFDAFGSDNASFFDAHDADFGPSSNPPSSSLRRPSFEEFSPSTDYHHPATSVGPSSFSGFDEFTTESDFATPSPKPTATNKGSAAAAVFGTVEDDFISSSVPVPTSHPTNADFLFDQADNDFSDSHGTFGPPSRQNSTQAGRTSFTQTSDFADIDFSLPQAPPSRQSSVAAGGSNPFFDSAPAPAPVPHHDPFGSEILTPSIASTAKPATFEGDLLDTSFSSSGTQQRKSVNLNNPMELLSLYDQPKPEPAKPSVMLNNSSAISSIPVMPTNNYHLNPGLGGPNAMRVPPPNPFAPPTPFAPPNPFGGIGSGGGAPAMTMSARSTGVASHPPFGAAPIYNGPPTAGMGMGSGAMYGGGPAPGAYSGYSAPVTPSPSFQGNTKIGNNPNAMKPNYGVSSDPFDSLNILKR